MCVIKLSSAASHRFAYNCSRSYQVFILLHWFHFRNQWKTGMCTCTSTPYHFSFEGLSFLLLLPSPFNSLFFLLCQLPASHSPFPIFSIFLVTVSPAPLPPLPLHLPVCHVGMEGKWELSSHLCRKLLSGLSASWLCVSVFVRLSSVCVCTMCMCDWVLSQPENRWNIPLQRIGVILKCWHEDYYSIQLHQICTVLKWYSTSLSSWLIYSFK